MSIYCFDLDGTLCTSTAGEYQKAEPFPERIKVVNKLYNANHTIIVDTARGATTGVDWSDLTVKQLKNWNCKYHILRVGKKFTADFYIDDRGIPASLFFTND